MRLVTCTATAGGPARRGVIDESMVIDLARVPRASDVPAAMDAFVEASLPSYRLYLEVLVRDDQQHAD